MRNKTTENPRAGTPNRPTIIPLWEPIVDEEFMRTWKLRPYQVDAVRSLQTGAQPGNRNSLMGMPVGGGRTATAAICRLYPDTGNASQILFLAGGDQPTAAPDFPHGHERRPQPSGRQAEFARSPPPGKGVNK